MDITSSWIVDKLVSYGVPFADARTLAAVAYGESGYNTAAVGDAGDSIGLFQINIPAHYPKLETWTGSGSRSMWEDWLKDPEHNVYAASEVYKSQGLGAWTVYNNDSYRAYMDTEEVGQYSGSTGKAVSNGISVNYMLVVLGVVAVVSILRKG